MPFRFRTSFKIAPGIRLNLSKGGASTSIGGRGHSLNVGKHGVRSTVGVPGTGLSYTTSTGSGSSRRSSGAGPRGLAGCFYYLFVWPLILLFKLCMWLVMVSVSAGKWIWAKATATPESKKISLIVAGIAATIMACFCGMTTLIGLVSPTATPTAIAVRAATDLPVDLIETSTPRPTRTVAPFPTMGQMPTSINPFVPAASPMPTLTLRPYVPPTSAVLPSPSTRSGGCCKRCGSDSQPCGDSCIRLDYTCHQPPGCACP